MDKSSPSEKNKYIFKDYKIILCILPWLKRGKNSPTLLAIINDLKSFIKYVALFFSFLAYKLPINVQEHFGDKIKK